MTLTDDVVETVDRCLVKSPDVSSRAAIAYLIASGATAISIIENETAYRVGSKISARAAVVYWLREDEARAVLRKARKLAGRSPDISTATAAPHRAAADARATLTEHAVATERASAMASKLDAYMASLRGTGVLKEFNRAFKRRAWPRC